MPLNIDWQQILLHLMNFAILSGGLYFLLYEPVRRFMEKRADYYRDMDEAAKESLQSAKQMEAAYQERLNLAQQEIDAVGARAKTEIAEESRRQLAAAQQQAEKLLADAETHAKELEEEALRSAQDQLRETAEKEAEKLLLQAQGNAFDQFLELAERKGAQQHA